MNLLHGFERTLLFGLNNEIHFLTQFCHSGLELVDFAENVRIIGQLFHGSVQICSVARCVVDV